MLWINPAPRQITNVCNSSLQFPLRVTTSFLAKVVDAPNCLANH